MKRRLAIGLGVVIALFLGALLLFSFSERVPGHQGKDVYEWMLAQNSSALEDNPGLMAIGSNAVPFLALALRTEQTMYDRYAWVSKGWFQRLAKDLHLNFRWRKSAHEVRSQAAWSLMAFGFESKSALPELHAELLRRTPLDTDRQRIVHCLSELGPPQESIPYLVKAFPLATKRDYGLRRDIIATLAKGGTNASRMAMPLVIGSLGDPHWEVCSVAAWTLARWAQPAPEAVPPLLSLLNSSTNDNAARWAAMALGRITNRCDEASPGLERLSHSTNDFTRAVAASSLWRLGGDADQTRQVLEELLMSRARGLAGEFLGQMGPIAKPSVPALLRAAQPVIGARVPTYARAQCAKAVLRIQGESAEAYQVLEEVITKEENHVVRGIVAGEVEELGALARPLIPALRKALNDSHREVRHHAALTLERLEVGRP